MGNLIERKHFSFVFPSPFLEKNSFSKYFRSFENYLPFSQGYIIHPYENYRTEKLHQEQAGVAFRGKLPSKRKNTRWKILALSFKKEKKKKISSRNTEEWLNCYREKFKVKRQFWNSSFIKINDTDFGYLKKLWSNYNNNNNLIKFQNPIFLLPRG